MIRCLRGELYELTLHFVLKKIQLNFSKSSLIYVLNWATVERNDVWGGMVVEKWSSVWGTRALEWHSIYPSQIQKEYCCEHVQSCKWQLKGAKKKNLVWIIFTHSHTIPTEFEAFYPQGSLLFINCVLLLGILAHWALASTVWFVTSNTQWWMGTYITFQF